MMWDADQLIAIAALLLLALLIPLPNPWAVARKRVFRSWARTWRATANGRPRPR